MNGMNGKMDFIFLGFISGLLIKSIFFLIHPRFFPGRTCWSLGKLVRESIILKEKPNFPSSETNMCPQMEEGETRMR